MMKSDPAGRVAVYKIDGYIPPELVAPFRPGVEIPELPGLPTSPQQNSTYTHVRNVLRMWSGCGDLENPLAGIIQPGMRVAIKPNLVLHEHPAGDHALRATVTDGALLRVLLDYVGQALHGDGTITIAESPIRATDFNRVVHFVGLDRVLDDVSSLWKVGVELVDVRDETVENAATFARDRRVRKLPGDPRGGVRVDLGTASNFDDFGSRMKRLRSTAAVGENQVRERHRQGKHEYEFSRSILDADLVISVPKMKTHKKAGMTGAVKNLVGSIVRKEWLPHHTQGAPSEGGDEFAEGVDVRLKMMERAKDFRMQTRAGNWVIRPLTWMYRHSLKGTPLDFLRVRQQSPFVNGGWSGNDTCWRMVHDVYRAFIYAQSSGQLAERPQRLPLTIVDGLIAGEGDGPLRPTPRNAGILAVGFEAPWVDHYLSLMMGFLPGDIPGIQRGTATEGRLPLTSRLQSEIDLVTSPAGLQAQLMAGIPADDAFVPPAGWASLVGGSPEEGQVASAGTFDPRADY